MYTHVASAANTRLPATLVPSGERCWRNTLMLRIIMQLWPLPVNILRRTSDVLQSLMPRVHGLHDPADMMSPAALQQRGRFRL